MLARGGIAEQQPTAKRTRCIPLSRSGRFPMTNRTTRVALTLGDPAGVGPELVARVMAMPPKGIEIVAVGSRAHFLEGAERAGLREADLCGDLEDVDAPNRVPVGQPSKAGGDAALAALRRAVDLATGGKVDGICTAPISKESVNAAGCSHRGHTELLGEWVGGGKPTMVFVAGRLRVALLTTHIPLAEVAHRVTKDAIAGGIESLRRALSREFGEPEAGIRVAALNPHLGEGGLLGREEADAISPGIALARSRGISVTGPESPETLFADRPGPVEGILALYHDQALGPLKAIHGLGMVNVTCGLPIIRTSPDHGTAFDIVGKGTASEKSLRMSVEWVRHIWTAKRMTDQ